MAPFPEDLAEWLDTFGDAAEFSPASPSAIDAFVSTHHGIPESLRQLWAEFGSCRFAGEATITGSVFRVWTVHGLDDTPHGLFHVWDQHPELKEDGLVPVLSDMDGNVVTWSTRNHSVIAVKFTTRPGENPGQRVPFYPTMDALWDSISVTEFTHPAPSAAPAGTHPGPTAEEQPVGLVTDHTLTRTFTNHLCFVVDTDRGEIFQGDLDDHGHAATSSGLTQTTIDDEVTVTLARAGVRPEPTDLQLAWDGVLDSPTREIGVMDPDGLIVMYCTAEPRARVRLWTDTGDNEPRRLVVLVG